MRLGFWPQVYGNWLLSDKPELSDATFEYARRSVLLAEAHGFDTCLLAEHFFNPLDARLDQLDAWTTASALAVLTSRIEIIAAVKAGLRAPGVIAKMAANISRMSRGRFAINLVSAWWPDEYEKLGAAFQPKEDRYARSEEFLTICRGLWTENDYSFHGKHFAVKTATISPKPDGTVPVYFGGESEEGRDIAARMADVFLLNARSPDPFGAVVREMRERAAAHGRTLRFGMPAFVICRDTEKAAEAEFDRLDGLRHAAINSDRPDVQKLNTRTGRSRRVGSNGGTDAGLVGTPEQIVARMREFEALGCETFLLQFYPLLEEIERFAAQVMPLLRREGARGGH